MGRPLLWRILIVMQLCFGWLPLYDVASRRLLGGAGVLLLFLSHSRMSFALKGGRLTIDTNKYIPKMQYANLTDIVGVLPRGRHMATRLQCGREPIAITGQIRAHADSYVTVSDGFSLATS